MYTIMMLAPIYTVDNCSSAYQLNWSLSLFWTERSLPSVLWLEPPKSATEGDHVRILEHCEPNPTTNQFLVSTRPQVSPSMIVRSVKGRLQYLVRESRPKAFRRNYSIHSVGSANLDVLERYIATQSNHHVMADPETQHRLARFQFDDPSVHLSRVRRSSYGEFVYNLQLVVVHHGRGVDVREAWLQTTRDTTIRISQKKKHLLKRVGITADHVHFLLGCDMTESPCDVALCYLNNLAHAHGMKRVFQFGYYVGTCGRYDLEAIRRVLSCSVALPPA